MTEQILAGYVEVGVLLDVLNPIVLADCGTADFRSFDRILIDGCVDHAQVVQNFARLRALTSAQETGNGDGRKEGDDRNYDHDFHQGETTTALGREFH